MLDLIGWGVEAYAGCSSEPVCAPPAATLLLAVGCWLGRGLAAWAGAYLRGPRSPLLAAPPAGHLLNSSDTSARPATANQARYTSESVLRPSEIGHHVAAVLVPMDNHHQSNSVQLLLYSTQTL
jgi:hypothetical protein